MTTPDVQPPLARRVPHTETAHGDVRHDDYAWLRDRTNPEVIAYLEAENAYTEAATAHTAGLRARLYEEMLSRLQQTDLDVPAPMDGWLYYSRTVEGQSYKIHARKRGEAGPEEVLLDLNALAEGHGYLRLGMYRPSPDHRRLAYSLDTSGAEDYTVFVKDLETGDLLPDRIERTSYGLEWAADSRTLFYGVQDEAKRLHAVRRHTLGESADRDEEVYHESDETFSVWLSRSDSRAYLVLNVTSKVTSEVWVLETDQPLEKPRVVAERRRGIEYSLEHHGEHFYILTNEGAVNFRLVAAPVSDPSPGNWREVIEHRERVNLKGLSAVARYLVISGREDGLSRLWVHDLERGETRPVEFEESVYTCGPGENLEFDTNRFRVSYSSFLTPELVFELDLDNLERSLLKRTEVLGDFDPARYESRRVFAPAPDGTRVPISLVHRRGALENGPAPLYLYGYGSYGFSIEPGFSAGRLSLLDRGVVFAIAHVRGGGELGRPWYELGKFLEKKNTFGDFIACAEHLIGEGLTSSSRLVAHGGSAGGLLVGAVVNARPDLFRAVVADVPFVDVVNTMLDPSIPLTTIEYDEWGNPNDPVYYAYMKSYSPYDNVAAQGYPAMLVTTGLNDPRVAFWEPAKWVARLRALKTDSHPLLLKTDLGAGHGGPSGRYEYLREVAFRFAFILDQLGVAD